jgi:hypothetical protein
MNLHTTPILRRQQAVISLGERMVWTRRHERHRSDENCVRGDSEKGTAQTAADGEA